MRDDFDQKTKDVLFRRARAKCSNPDCRKETSEAHSEEDKAVNTGVAAHITAASPGGPRYDPTLSVDERKAAQNGIWLCQNCAHLVDADPLRYSVEVLRKWKRVAEAGDERGAAKMAMFSRLEEMMPTLLEEMRKDLATYPLIRECVLLKKGMLYNPGPTLGEATPYLAYHYEDHDFLDDKFTILCNHRLLLGITPTTPKRYRFTEDLVDYLTQKQPVGEQTGMEGSRKL
jgi:hypothetical protein